jgi:hypothetical protein
MMEDNEEENYDNNFPSQHPGLGAFDNDAAMEEPKNEAAENDPTDELGQAFCGAQEDCESEKERLKF